MVEGGGGVVWEAQGTGHRVHTEWQWLLSGIHFTMMEKSAQPGGYGKCTPTPFHYIYYHLQSCSVRSSLEGRYTPPISSLPLYVLYGTECTCVIVPLGSFRCTFTVMSQRARLTPS
jgi:hypothetical protein